MNISEHLVEVGKRWVKSYFSTLIHHGVKGQRKGIRNGPPYPIKKKVSSSYEVEDPKTGETHSFVDGTRIQDKEIFAGKGSKTPLHEDVAEGLSKQIGGDPSEWKHCKGKGTLDYHGEEREAEVHWFEEPTVGKHKFKIKKWLDD